MLTRSICVVSMLCLIGCTSEIDKCVDSQIQAWKERTEANKKLLSEKDKQGKSTLGELWDLVPEKMESEVRADARVKCLKSASKN